VDVLLSSELSHIGLCIESVFGFAEAVAAVQCKAPERLVRLLSATIADGNLVTASKLQVRAAAAPA
jgi:hypothetical protein